MITKNIFTFALLSASYLIHSSAFAQNCKKNDISGCPIQSELTFAQESIKGITADEIFRGQDSKPALTQSELDSKVVFCKYVYHKFSSPGSAKFNCARTNNKGTFFDENGQLVAEATRVAAEGEKVLVNGKSTAADEGLLIGANGSVIIKANKKGEMKAVKADVIKVKYFVNKNEISNGKHQPRTVTLGGQTLQINAFENSPVIENKRWTEVFTEVAASRLFWAMGIPADIMIPVNKVVCIGCEVHPKDQKSYNGDNNVSIFNVAVIERNFDAKKMGEQWDLKDVLATRSKWSERAKVEYDVMHLTMTMINFYNGIALQNRAVCLSNEDVKSQNCSRPALFYQDLGSSFGAKTGALFGLGENPRGDYDSFIKKGNDIVVKNAATCEINMFLSNGGHGRKNISQSGLEEFKNRVAGITDDVLLSIYKTARFDLMEPDQTAKKGADKVLADWVSATRKRINQVTALKSCPNN
jgi:hypothetical protein